VYTLRSVARILGLATMAAAPGRTGALPRAKALLKMCAGALTCWLMLGGSAHAHSELMATAPAEGAVLHTSPLSIALTFNEPVSPLVLRLLGAGGKPVDLGQAAVRDATLTVPLPARLPPGSYLFSWRIASADGHPVGGTLSFAIGAADRRATLDAAPAYPMPGLYPAIAVTGLALLAGLLFGIGGVAFNAWAAEYEAGGGRKHLPALLLALIAAPVSLGLQGLDALAAPWSALLTRPCWSVAMGTSYGRLVLVAEAAALVGLFACTTGSARWRRVLALGSVLLLGLALASSGHAATATIGVAAPVTVFLHVVAVAGWLGALACLPFLLGAGYGETALRRFSAAAGIIVVLLVMTGMLLAWWQLREPADLWRTSYGRILAAKLILVLGLLALAAINRWRWTGAALAGDGAALRALVRNIRVEIVFAIAVLCAVTLWRFTPPPRALPPDSTVSVDLGMSMGHAMSPDHPQGQAMSPSDAMSSDPAMSSDRAMPPEQAMAPNAAMSASPVTLHLHGGNADGTATIHATPDGHARVRIAIVRLDGTSLPAKEVSLTFSNSQAGVEGIVRSARRETSDDAAGAWVVDDVPLLVSGPWNIKADALVTDFDSVSLEGQGDIKLNARAHR
jgi:copper transport protein